MFTKMQKYYISVFAIAAVVLVFADANGFAESAELRRTAAEVATARTTTTTARSSVALVGAAAAASEEAAEGGQAEQAQLEAKKVQSIPAGKEYSGVEAKTAQLEKPTTAVNQGLSTTTIATTKNTTTTATAAAVATTRAAAVVTAKTMTLASSNAPATLTTTNDVDERVLSTAATPAVGAAINDEQAKPQKQAQAERVEVVGSSFIKADAGERPTIATKSLSTTKINAAVQMESRVTPQVASTHAGGSSAATKITEAPTVNFESKSRADTEPLKTDYGTIAVAKQQEASRGNVAKTQIIKNEKELCTKRLNERADAHINEQRGGGETKLEAPKTTDTGAIEAHSEGESDQEEKRMALSNEKRLNSQNKEEREQKSEGAVEKNNDSTQAKKKPQMDDTPTWPKEALETTNKLASKEAETMTRPEPAETVTSHAKFSVNGATNVNLPMPNATIAKTSSEHRKPAATATTQATPSSDMNIERKLKNGPYRIKLAEIATVEYNGSGSGEEKELLEAKPSATNSETRVGTTTVDSVLETSQLNRKEGHAVGGLEALTSNTQQKKQQTGIQQELGQQAQQTAATKLQKQQQELKKQQQAKLVKQKAQQASGEQELEQHKQPKPAIQLSREQQQQQQQYQASNKDMDIGQVQQQQQQKHYAYTASELDNKNQKSNSNNKSQQSDDHDTYTNPANTKQASAQPTPPALNIVDLYPMKMEDFNPIIRDSNAKLLKERTIYKPTASDEAAEEQDQRLEHAEDGYGGVDSATSDGLMKSSVGHQQNLLPNEVNTADSIIRRHYDNINNLAAAQQHSVNRRPIMPVTEEGASSAESTTNSHQQRKQQKLWKPDAISDFTGKLLAEQDGVITEIEQKFRLNEFTATEQPTITTTAKDIKQVEAPQASAVNKLSHSVNHKIQPSKSLKSKYNKESVTHLPPTQKHDFIERRVKKSFDFPMHRTASASDTLGMPHVDFANTKFNTGSGATQSLSPTTLSDRGGALGVRTALGTHPEFSTTKFYNSKELYNEMMSHNRQRLKAKAKMEQGTASAVAATARTLAVTGVETTMAATNTASNGVASAASRFAFSQNSKLETSKQAPTKAAVRQAIMGEMNMNSQRIARVNSGGASMRTVELKGDEVSLTNARAEEGQSHLTAKSNVEGGISNFVGVERQDSASVQHGYQHTNVQLSKQSTATITNNQTSTAETPSNTAILGAKTTKKYHKELQRAKLLLKSLLLPTTNDSVGAGANKSSDAGATMSTTKTTTTLKPNSNSQTNLHAPPTVRGELDKNAPAPSRVDLVASAKTFDIMSLRASKSRQVATPTIATSAAVGNIDSTIDSDMTAAGTEAEGLQVKLGNSAGSDLVHVKRAKPPQTTSTTSKLEKTTTRTTSSAETSISTKNPTPATSTVTNPTVDPSTNIPLIYPYPQMPRQVTMLITQPHDTTATVSSAKSSSSSSSGSAHTSYTTSTAASPTTGSTNLLAKSASKPIVRPRILSPLQEKINSLECEVQNVPSDSHLWRGNETHELLLPIVSSENCPYGSIDCSPLLVSWDGEAEIQSGDILIVEINDTLLNTSEHNVTHTSLAHNTQVYQVTRSGHEHCDVTEGILLDITPLVVDGRKLVTLYDKDLTEGVNLLIVVSELWGPQCVRLKVTAKTDNCGESAECSGKGVCYSNAAMEEYECQCCSGFAGPHCEEIDACTPSPCTNNGICVDLSQGHEGNSYQCLCPYGYTGKNCQYESDPCNSAECMNGGTCVGNSTHFRCDCTPGYTGPLCQHSLNECESSPCVHGICVDQEDGFRCFCQPGFAGELCNFEYNECESNPCQNDGECIDHIGNFECRCTKGYTGARCQIKVDFCANKPCPDGHHCIDHGNDFTCECPGGRNGLDCNQMPPRQCAENLCKHGGTCWTSGASFYCACRPGYTGNMCEDEFVVETVVSSSEFMVDDTSARNFNDKTFGSSVVLKSPIELHNAYFGAGVLASAVFIVAIVVTICHCKVNHTYRKFSTRSSTFFPILGFGRRSKSQNKLNKHWLSGKGMSGAGGGASGGLLRSTSGSTTSLTRGHLPSAQNASGLHQSQQQRQQQQQLQQQQLGGQMHERPFQRHLAMNLENDMYYTVDFSENSQHSPLIQ